MAVRKAVVIDDNGRLAELPSGDTLEGVSGGGTEIATPTNAAANSTYPTGNYSGNTLTANGFPVAGRLTGYRNGTDNVQRLKSFSTSNTYERNWVEGTTSWSPWGRYIDTNDFTAKGQINIATANNESSPLAAPSSRQPLIGNTAAANGVQWGGGADFVEVGAMVKVMDPGNTAFHAKIGMVGNAGIGYYPGIWLNQETPSVFNYAFLGDGQNSKFNSVGPMGFRINNVDKLIITADGYPQAVALATNITPPVTTGLVKRVVADQNGLLSTIVEDKQNAAVADQTVNAATTQLLTGSLVTIPDGALKGTSVFWYTLALSKTNAGTAANTFLFKIGTAGTTADTTILTFTLPVGTAAVDVGKIEIMISIQTVAGTATPVRGNLVLMHNGNTAGLATIPIVVLNATGTVNTTLTGLKASLTCTTAASTVLTFQQVIAETINL